MKKKPIDWQHFEACVRAARAVGCDEDEARDVAIATLEQLSESEQSRPLSQIRRRARWRAGDALRTRNRSVKVVDGYDPDRVESADSSPEQLLAVKQALAAVDERSAKVVIDGMEGKTDEAIAKEHNVTAGAVRQIRSRVRRALSNLFKEE